METFILEPWAEAKECLLDVLVPIGEHAQAVRIEVGHVVCTKAVSLSTPASAQGHFLVRLKLLGEPSMV